MCSTVFIKLGPQIDINYSFSKSKLIIQQSFPQIYSECHNSNMFMYLSYAFMSDPDFLLFAVIFPWFLGMN